MVSLNRVFLAGNLTRTPEVRYIPSGMAVTDLGMAMNRVFIDKNGEKKEEATFVDVVVWGKQAESACQYLKKGSPLLVEGALQFDQWEQDGQKRSKLRVKANRIQFLGGGQNKTQGGQMPFENNQPMQPQMSTAPHQNFTPPPPPQTADIDDDIPF